MYSFAASPLIAASRARVASQLQESRSRLRRAHARIKARSSQMRQHSAQQLQHLRCRMQVISSSFGRLFFENRLCSGQGIPVIWRALIRVVNLYIRVPPVLLLPCRTLSNVE